MRFPRRAFPAVVLVVLPLLPGLSPGGEPATKEQAEEAPFLRLQEEIGKLLVDADRAISEGLKGDPVAGDSHSQKMKFIKARIEMSEKLSSRKSAQSQEMLETSPRLKERIAEKGWIFDGARWTDPASHCERIAALCGSAYKLKEAERRVDTEIARVEAALAEQKDNAYVRSIDRSGGSAAPQQVFRDDPQDRAARTRQPSASEIAAAAARASATRISTLGKDLKTTKRMREEIQDLQAVVCRRIQPLLRIAGIEETLTMNGYYVVEGLWFKS